MVITVVFLYYMGSSIILMICCVTVKIFSVNSKAPIKIMKNESYTNTPPKGNKIKKYKLSVHLKEEKYQRGNKEGIYIE